jgi:hypothetical protein
MRASRLRFFATAAIVAVCLVAMQGAAHATSGSANCFLVTGTAEGVNPEGKVNFDLSYRYIVQSKKLEGTHSVDEVLVPGVDFATGELEPDHHREIRTQNTLVEMDIAWGVTDRFTLAAGLPLINQRDHEHDAEVGTPSEFFTKEDGASGFGDVRLTGRYAFLVKTKDLLVGGLTLKLPTGQYKLSDSQGEINEPTIQPGSGSYDVVAGAYYAHQLIPMRLEYFLSASRKTNSENDLDYRFGAESLLNAGISHNPSDRFTWLLQINARRTTHDTFAGHLVDSTGGTLVNLTPGFRLQAASTTSFYAFVQIPVYQNVNDAQLAPRTGLLTGISKTF